MAGFLYFDSDELVDFSIDSCIFLPLVGNDLLDGLLLFFQCGDHLLLLHLFAFERLVLLDAAVEQYVLLLLGLCELIVFLLHLRSLGLHHLALHSLVGGIFAHEPHASEHLGKVLGTEDKHQLVLDGAVAMHIPQ